MDFDYNLDFDKTNFRENPELYRIGRGEQGVLLVEPYKSELLPYWRFKTPDVAEVSANKIYEMFLEYLQRADFVGADMARKFLQMGYTRSRRYANHPTGRKYKLPPAASDRALQSGTKQLPYPYSNGSPNKPNAVEPQAADALTNEKAMSAQVFKQYWDKARANEDYLQQKAQHKAVHEAP